MSFGAGVPGPPAGRPEPPAEEARVSAEAVASLSVASGPRRPVSHVLGRAGLYKFPLNAFGGVALSELVGDWESVQVLRFISGADPDPRSFAAGAASTTAPASSTTTSAPVDASVEDFPEPLQSLVWRCRGLCMDCKKACCGKSDEDSATPRSSGTATTVAITAGQCGRPSTDNALGRYSVESASLFGCGNVRLLWHLEKMISGS